MQTALLNDGKRLHCHDGPIDLIIEAFGPGRDAAYRRAIERFDGLLQELVDDLILLRSPTVQGTVFRNPVAQRMQVATLGFGKQFITPMAAVAGAVADEILSVMAEEKDLNKVYVNNGGDAAFLLRDQATLSIAIAGFVGGKVTLDASSNIGGIATSGWRGRSFSLGIADSVTVLAANAAKADATATLIANAVDLPGHPAIKRGPASAEAPDSDLGDRLVTLAVPPLSAEEINTALNSGADYASKLIQKSRIDTALIELQGKHRTVLSAVC